MIVGPNQTLQRTRAPLQVQERFRSLRGGGPLSYGVRVRHEVVAVTVMLSAE